MSCLPCFQSKKANEPPAKDLSVPVAPPPSPPHFENNYKPPCENANKGADQASPVENGDSSNAKTFTFRELASATKNFRQECLIGEGGFGRVFKGTLQGGEVVAVKQLDRTGTQGNKEFQVEVLMLNIKEDKKALDWRNRIKIASGAAQGLEYLHEKANPPIIYQYERSGELSFKSDVYSFGVVLLELITGRRAVDTTRPPEEQNLVAWAQPIFRNPKRFREMADPVLKSRFPERSLNQAVGVAAMCLQEEPSVRPLISDAVAALTTLDVNEPIPES
ncbi:hypothetical protein RND71_014330 [Anisodus tanguticus]|uniref:Protein kinase domain-containing protein n=1 Tax=Anisodus tanguticus TaxID=243964 RepID=A0AAE1SAH4_9SOLA|nr:hypothetical protein RND71_014330 [Anisodus tanguticus]